MSRFAVLSLSLFLLAGCNSQTAYQGVDYSTTAPVRMNIADVLVDTEYKSPGAAPNYEHNLAVSPADALRTAITHHYAPERRGSMGSMTLRFNIRDASITEQQTVPPADNFFDRSFGNQVGTYVYNGRLQIETTTEGPQRRNRGTIQTEVTRTLEVTNGSEADRARLVKGMVEQMVDDAIVQLDQQISGSRSAGPLVISGSDQQIDPQRSGRWDHVMEDRVARSAGMRVITTK